MAFNIVNPLFPKPTFHASAQVAAQRLTVTSTATVQFSAFDGSTDMVTFDVQTAGVYCTFDGTTPSATAGHILAPGEKYTWSAAGAKLAKFVATTTTNAIIYGSEFQL